MLMHETCEWTLSPYACMARILQAQIHRGMLSHQVKRDLIRIVHLLLDKLLSGWAIVGVTCARPPACLRATRTLHVCIGCYFGCLFGRRYERLPRLVSLEWSKKKHQDYTAMPLFLSMSECWSSGNVCECDTYPLEAKKKKEEKGNMLRTHKVRNFTKAPGSLLQTNNCGIILRAIAAVSFMLLACCRSFKFCSSRWQTRNEYRSDVNKTMEEKIREESWERLSRDTLKAILIKIWQGKYGKYGPGHVIGKW